MRNAVLLANGLVLTTDNSAAIGEKEHDIVAVPDELVSYFAARVALLEQWAASAYPVSIVVHNFTGNESWNNYISGIKKLFHEIGEECPVITGSSESNMATLQSAMAVTMIGEKREKLLEPYNWFVYGKPCVGNEVIEEAERIADIQKIWEALCSGLVQRVWPVGSSGILGECKQLGLQGKISDWDIVKSAGPATTVLLGITTSRLEEAKKYFGKYFDLLH